MGIGATIRYIADTEADLPETGPPQGTLGYSRDTRQIFIFIDGAWGALSAIAVWA
jgi:hypothetical protein